MALKDILGGVRSFASGGYAEPSESAQAEDVKKQKQEKHTSPDGDDDHRAHTSPAPESSNQGDDDHRAHTSPMSISGRFESGASTSPAPAHRPRPNAAGAGSAALSSDPFGKAEGGHVDKVDADSLIDSFLEENPDLVDTPVEEWPEDAIKLLQKTLNAEGIDEPDGALPGEPGDETTGIESKGDGDIADIGKEPTTDVDNPEQDFDIAELAKLVNAGDKDGAWDMLQSMFGTAPAAEGADTVDTPTNALDRLSKDSDIPSDQRIKKPANTLGKLLGSLRF